MNCLKARCYPCWLISVTKEVAGARGHKNENDRVLDHPGEWDIHIAR
jgi:hypothetical protein